MIPYWEYRWRPGRKHSEHRTFAGFCHCTAAACPVPQKRTQGMRSCRSQTQLGTINAIMDCQLWTSVLRGNVKREAVHSIPMFSIPSAASKGRWPSYNDPSLNSTFASTHVARPDQRVALLNILYLPRPTACCVARRHRLSEPGTQYLDSPRQKHRHARAQTPLHHSAAEVSTRQS